MGVVIVVVLLAVLALGVLVFWLTRRSQVEVPSVADANAARRPRVLATDEQGNAITDAEEPEQPPRDESAFEALLEDEIHSLGRQEPPKDSKSPGDDVSQGDKG